MGIAMMMMLAQQLSGINCAMFYSTSIFSTAGLNPSQSQSATLGMGAMNVAMTFVSLALIEKAGRKVLMVSGLSLMLCMTILLLASLLTFEVPSPGSLSQSCLLSQVDQLQPRLQSSSTGRRTSSLVS